jgi:ribokinase
MKMLTVGGAMLDTIAIVDSDRIEHLEIPGSDGSFLLLEEGRKTEAEEVSTHLGGGAVNAAQRDRSFGHRKVLCVFA